MNNIIKIENKRELSSLILRFKTILDTLEIVDPKYKKPSMRIYEGKGLVSCTLYDSGDLNRLELEICEGLLSKYRVSDAADDLKYRRELESIENFSIENFIDDLMWLQEIHT